MARTKASVGSKVSSFKSSKARCSVAPPTNFGSTGGTERAARGSTGGGNPVCPRETPKWQKPITNFFICNNEDSKEVDVDIEEAGTSKPKTKQNIIHSDDEETTPEEEQTRNSVLYESLELQPLNGENSHKIEEYYKGDKGKGVGKKSRGKENRRDSKRVRDDEDESVSKRVKVDQA